MVSGHGICVVSLVGNDRDPLLDHCTHVQTNWPVNAFKESGAGDIEKALTLVAERTGAQPEDLRFVYGFDSCSPSVRSGSGGMETFPASWAHRFGVGCRLTLQCGVELIELQKQRFHRRGRTSLSPFARPMTGHDVTTGDGGGGDIVAEHLGALASIASTHHVAVLTQARHEPHLAS